jgi:hypothetical protein
LHFEAPFSVSSPGRLRSSLRGKVSHRHEAGVTILE